MGLTDLRQHIIYEDYWLPEDIEQHYRSNRGAIYGVVADKKKNKGFKFLNVANILITCTLLVVPSTQEAVCLWLL